MSIKEYKKEGSVELLLLLLSLHFSRTEFETEFPMETMQTPMNE